MSKTEPTEVMNRVSDQMWVLFSQDWDYDHPALVMTTLAFRAGETRLLSRSIAVAAIAAGRAAETDPPADAETGEDGHGESQ